jgi:glycine cleavage system H protein
MEQTYYTEDHEWLRMESDDVAVVGITDFAQEQLGDVVFVELPKVGADITRGEAVAVVESVKAAADVKAPASGNVLEVNDALAASPELVNEDPVGRAWFYKVRIANKDELSGLMDEKTYAGLTKKK